MSKLRNDLRTSFLFVIVGVAIFFPILFLYFVPNEFLNTLSLVLNIVYAIIWVYAYTVLKSLLRYSKVTDMEGVLNWVIGILVVSTALSTVIGLKMMPDGVALVLNMLTIMVAGALLIMLGIKFLNIKSEFYGKKTALGYLNIFAGVCFASIILVPFGLILQVITDIYTATLFDRASKEIK